MSYFLTRLPVAFWHWMCSNALRMKRLAYVWISMGPFSRDGRENFPMLKGRDAWTQDEMGSSPDVTSNPSSFTNPSRQKGRKFKPDTKATLIILPGVCLVVSESLFFFHLLRNGPEGSFHCCKSGMIEKLPWVCELE